MPRLLALTLLSVAIACSDATAPVVDAPDLQADAGMRWADVGKVCAPSKPAVPLLEAELTALDVPCYLVAIGISGPIESL